MRKFKDIFDCHPDENMDFETMVKTLWPSVMGAHERMLSGFPTVWDAYWYGTFTTLFSQVCFEKGDKAVERIVGKKNYRKYMEEQEMILGGMHDSCCQEAPEDILAQLQAVIDGR
ncbi:hypothetical protein [Desulfomonile tiedjei]|uniref:Uncharacterized protein n=1 Tax=Desulfomonile tiedjei (strain ATCC 49306 / DSM 6799 / DCB-1) TaxID=706587 RepID=I4CAK9_DESTA|nr:hypothetical protein [Desulfomonile tiedjei]AFM26600.1 hypothetical protein Desti_3958 [Desulfomonile tiedjei DSM 6799]